MTRNCRWPETVEFTVSPLNLSSKLGLPRQNCKSFVFTFLVTYMCVLSQEKSCISWEVGKVQNSRWPPFKCKRHILTIDALVLLTLMMVYEYLLQSTYNTCKITTLKHFKAFLSHLTYNYWWKYVLFSSNNVENVWKWINSNMFYIYCLFVMLLLYHISDLCNKILKYFFVTLCTYYQT